MCRLVFCLRLWVCVGVSVFVFVYFEISVFMFVSTVLSVLCISYVSSQDIPIDLLNAG